MAALAIYAVTAALLKDRADTHAPPPATPDQAPPENPRDDPAGQTGDQTLASRRLPAPEPPGHATHWLNCPPRPALGYAAATPDTIQRRFLETPGQIITSGDTITVRLERRAYSPVLRKADLPAATTVPWWGNRILRYELP